MGLSEYTVFNENKKFFKDTDIIRTIRFLVPAQNATVSPPIGPILGQFGINIMDFCKKFNDLSRNYDNNSLVIVILFLHRNKSFTFYIKPPSVSFLVNETSFFLSSENIPRFLFLTSFYKILRFKKFSLFYDDKIYSSSIFGTLRTMHLSLCNDIF